MKPRWLLIATLIGLALASSVSASTDRVLPVPGAARSVAALEQGKAIARAMTVTRLGVSLAAIALIAAGSRIGRRGDAASARRRRRVCLTLLAALAFAASYNLFQWRHYDGIHAHEVFHYYLGAKYFPELGYVDLYECAVVAVSEDRPAEAGRPHVIRDLRHILSYREVVPALSSESCRARFSDAHWAQFKHDALWLEARLPGPHWERVITDQGLNATPVWILFGRPMAWLTPADGEWMPRYVRLDVLLLMAAFGVVLWTFGIETASLAVIAWAANPLAAYGWVGDAPLRQMWFASSLIGICLLARRRFASAGAFMATASLLRVFPLFYSIGYALWHLRAALRERRLRRDLVRFVAGGLATGALLIAAAIGVCGRGPGVIAEFADNMQSYASLTARNSVGLRVLLSLTSETPVPALMDGRLRVTESEAAALARRTFESRRFIYWSTIALCGWLFWRALPRVRDWEAACMGFVLILLFTQAAGYYMTCCVPVAFLAAGRPRVAYGLLSTLIGWCAISLTISSVAVGYALSSAVVLALAVYVMIEMARTEPANTEEPPALAGGSRDSDAMLPGPA